MSMHPNCTCSLVGGPCDRCRRSWTCIGIDTGPMPAVARVVQIDTTAGVITVKADPTMRPGEINMETEWLKLPDMPRHQVPHPNPTFAAPGAGSSDYAFITKAPRDPNRGPYVSPVAGPIVGPEVSAALKARAEARAKANRGCDCVGLCRGHAPTGVSVTYGAWYIASGIAMDMERLASAPRPIDPLDVVVQPGKATLRSLLNADESMRREGAVAFPFLPEQRAAVSAHWSAQLRARVKAGEAADRAKRPSVVVDVDAEDLPW